MKKNFDKKYMKSYWYAIENDDIWKENHDKESLDFFYPFLYKTIYNIIEECLINYKESDMEMLFIECLGISEQNWEIPSVYILSDYAWLKVLNKNVKSYYTESLINKIIEDSIKSIIINEVVVISENSSMFFKNKYIDTKNKVTNKVKFINFIEECEHIEYISTTEIKYYDSIEKNHNIIKFDIDDILYFENIMNKNISIVTSDRIIKVSILNNKVYTIVEDFIIGRTYDEDLEVYEQGKEIIEFEERDDDDWLNDW